MGLLGVAEAALGRNTRRDLGRPRSSESPRKSRGQKELKKEKLRPETHQTNLYQKIKMKRWMVRIDSTLGVLSEPDKIQETNATTRRT